MEVFEIVSYDGKSLSYIKADNERQALCMYLMNHEELNDMMLWQSVNYPNRWKLAVYDDEYNYIYARRTYDF